MSIFAIGLILYFVLTCYYLFLPIPESYSNLGFSIVTYGGLATLCFFLQREHRPHANQLGVRAATLARARTLVWVGGGIAFTAVELGLMDGFARLLLATLPQHHVWIVRLYPLNRVVQRPFALLIPVVAGPVLEELLFRGHLYLVLRQNWGRRRAAVISSAIFAVLHLPTAPLVVFAFFASLIYVYLDNKARSLAPSIAAHASYNAVLWLLRSNLS